MQPVQGKEKVLEKELDLLAGAEHIIVMTGALYLPSELEAIVPLLYRSVERGVTLVVVSRARVVVAGRTLDIKEALLEIPGKKRFEEAEPGIKKILVDGKSGMVAYADKDDSGILPGSVEAVFTTNRVFLEGFNPR